MADSGRCDVLQLTAAITCNVGLTILFRRTSLKGSGNRGAEAVCGGGFTHSQAPASRRNFGSRSAERATDAY
ncbi:hypothetical protein ACVIJ6_001665 [Bradyrhizobium sp. USDA 4369]